MEDTSQLLEVSMNFLCLRCREETERFFQHQEHDPRYCYELFRRAISNCDELAWECLYHRYHKLVSSWVERHPLYPELNEETEVLVNQAFEKMWAGLSAEKFANFFELKAVLRYLQLCVHSVVVDLARARERAACVETAALEDLGEAGLDEVAEDPDLGDQFDRRIQAGELWNLLEKRIKNEKERRVLEGLFMLGLKPARVFAHYQGIFKDVLEVYNVRDNLMARLRRDAELRAIFEDRSA